MQFARRPGGRQRPRPDAEIVGGEASFEPPSRFTSLDHLVGAGEQRRRHVEAERLGRFLIYYKLVLCGELGRRVRRRWTFLNSSNVDGGPPVRDLQVNAH